MESLPTGAGQGQRVTRVEDEVITHFYYTGSALLFTTVNEYVLQTQNILDPSGTIVASKRFEGQAETEQDPYADDYFFYRYDIRGSVTNIVDGAGAVVKSYDYDEFGVTTSTGDTFFNEVTFTGSVADASGLLYMNARYYNPTTARFLSQDTYTGSASDPWTQHLYAYCNNNPVNMVDPTGHAPVGPMRKNMVCINDGSTGVWRDEMETNANGDILCGEDLVSILKNIDVRFEQTVVDDSIGLPGFFELGISSIDGHSNIYDQDGIYPIIGTTDGRLMGGVGVYSHARITALTMSAGSLSLEIGYGEVSFGITIFAKGSPFERSNMWGIGIDYTQYTGNGNYVRTTNTMEVNPLLVVAALIFISTGAPVPALAPVI